MKIEVSWDTISFINILNNYKFKGEPKTSFARRMGFKSHKIIQDWAKGQKPRPESLEQIRERLAISDEDYEEMWDLAYGLVVKKRDNTLKEDKRNKIIYASELPSNYLAKRLVELRDENETEREFIERVGIPSDVWDHWCKTELPEISAEDMTQLIFNLADTLGKDKRKEILELNDWFVNQKIKQKERDNGNKRGMPKMSKSKRRRAS